MTEPKVEIQIASSMESRRTFSVKEFTTRPGKKKAKLTNEVIGETTEVMLDSLEVELGADKADVLDAIKALTDLGVEGWHCYRYPGERKPWVIYWRHPNCRVVSSSASAATAIGMFRAAAVAEEKRQRNVRLYEAQRHLGHARASLYGMGFDSIRDSLSETIDMLR